MCYTEHIGTTNENKVDKKELIMLAMEFGLPCIERATAFFIIGEETILVFDKECLNKEEIERWQQQKTI